MKEGRSIKTIVEEAKSETSMSTLKYCKYVFALSIVTISFINYFQIRSLIYIDIDKTVQTEAKEWVNASTATTTSEETQIEYSKSEDETTTFDQPVQRHVQDFTYDKKRWEKNSPRIAVLAGPHKTASTTLQEFFSKIVGSAVHLTNETFNSSTTYEPHPALSDWAWPIGVAEEYATESSLGGGFKEMRPRKFYAVLASLISGRRRSMFFPTNTKEQFAKATEYHKALFQSPFQQGKKIVIAAEAFDTLVEELIDGSASNNDKGEDTHIAPTSGEMIDALLGLFPFDNRKDNNSSTTSENGILPLKLEDIEVHINYRTPKISHVKSIWHQLGKRYTFRGFLLKNTRRKSLYQSNSLGLALQFARRGIKTSLLDMAGVEEESQSFIFDNETVVGGLRGVVACDVLRMGSTNDLCDDHSRLHLPEFNERNNDKTKNKKKDKNPIGLTIEQMDEINSVMEEYDCAVWQHLEKYQSKGTLRVLYPSENLFSNCNPHGNRDISFESTIEKVVGIASRENGIPFNEDIIYKIQKQKNKKIKLELSD